MHVRVCMHVYMREQEKRVTDRVQNGKGTIFKRQRMGAHIRKAQGVGEGGREGAPCCTQSAVVTRGPGSGPVWSTWNMTQAVDGSLWGFLYFFFPQMPFDSICTDFSFFFFFLN